MSRAISNEKYWWYSKKHNHILKLSGPEALSYSLMVGNGPLIQILEAQVETFKLIYDAEEL